jgi:hypothetical protein
MALQYFASLTATSSDGFGGWVPFVVPGATGITLNATCVRIENTGSSSALYISASTACTTGTGWPLNAGSSAAIQFTAQPHRYFQGFSYNTTALTSIAFTVLAIR